LARKVKNRDTTPVGLVWVWGTHTQRSRLTATLGFEPQPRWGRSETNANGVLQRSPRLARPCLLWEGRIFWADRQEVHAVAEARSNAILPVLKLRSCPLEAWEEVNRWQTG